MIGRLWLAGLILLLLTGASPNVKRIDSIAAGRWEGSAYVSRKTGKFLSCIIGFQFDNGILLHFSIDRDSELWITLTHGDWRIDDDTSGKIRMDVDGAYLGTFPFYQVTSKQIEAIIHGSELVIQRLSRGHRLRIVAPQATFHFDLRDSAKALAAARACVRRQLAIEQGSANPAASASRRLARRADSHRVYRFDRSRTADRRVARRYPMPPSSTEERRVRKPSPRPKARNVGAKAWKLFAMIAMGEEAQVVPVEPRLRRLGIEQSWSSNGIRGYAGRWKASGSVNSVTNKIIGGIGGACDDYATTMQKTEWAGDSEVKTAFAQCRIGESVKVIAATATRNSKVFSIFVHIGDESKRDSLRAINNRVVTFIIGMNKRASR